MANPQKENGFTPIANEIAQALARKSLSASESQIVWVILTKTYGWQKKEDWISLSQFVEATGISKPHVCRALRMLLEQNIVTKGGTLSRPRYSLQKDHEQWKDIPKGGRKHSPNVTKGGTHALPKGAPPKRYQRGQSSVTKGGNRALPKGAHTKETITKESFTKEEDIAKVDQSDGIENPKLVVEMIKTFNDWLISKSGKPIGYGNVTQRKAAQRVLDVLGEQDAMLAVKAALQANGAPYAPTITSPVELENKLPKLRLFYERLRQEKGGLAVIS